MDLDAIARDLAAALEGGQARRAKNAQERVITGRLRGVHVTLSCDGSNQLRGWRVHAKGAAPPLLVSVDKRAIGETSEPIPTGDAAFDAEWIVTGAPADTARLLVDEDVRAAVARAGDVSFAIDDGAVDLSGPNTGAFYGAADVLRGAELVVLLRERLAALARSGVGAGADAERAVAARRAADERVFANVSWPGRVALIAAGLLLAAAVIFGVRGCFG